LEGETDVEGFYLWDFCLWPLCRIPLEIGDLETKQSIVVAFCTHFYCEMGEKMEK